MARLERDIDAPRPRFDAVVPSDLWRHGRVPNVTNHDLLQWETVRWAIREALLERIGEDRIVLTVDPFREAEARPGCDVRGTMTTRAFIAWFESQMHTFRLSVGMLPRELSAFLADIEKSTAYNIVAARHAATG